MFRRVFGCTMWSVLVVGSAVSVLAQQPPGAAQPKTLAVSLLGGEVTSLAFAPGNQTLL